MDIDTRTSELEPIPEAECWELVASVTVGRVAVAAPGGPPIVVPVNHAVHEGGVLFRTGPGTTLELLREQPVSFQTDLVDPYHRTGWSVLVQGVADLVDAGEPGGEHGEHRPPVRPWAPGGRDQWVRIRCVAITGRRLSVHLDDMDARGYL